MYKYRVGYCLKVFLENGLMLLIVKLGNGWGGGGGYRMFNSE